MDKKLIEYSHNNSGGGDWLSEEDWLNLEKAGWRTCGFYDFVYDKYGNTKYDKDGLPELKSISDNKKYAYKFFDSLEEAIEEFEEITGENANAEGCNCCGQPHNFNIEN